MFGETKMTSPWLYAARSASNTNDIGTSWITSDTTGDYATYGGHARMSLELTCEADSIDFGEFIRKPTELEELLEAPERYRKMIECRPMKAEVKIVKTNGKLARCLEESKNE